VTAQPEHRPKPVPPLLAYSRLFRLPNVPTAVADVMMGYVLVHGSLDPAIVFLCLVGASCLLYVSGMVLNDVYDLKTDAGERPERPLPSGAISPGWAKWLGYEMLLLGVALGWIAGYACFGLTATAWRSGVVATVLAACVVAYDMGLKRTAVGPLVMGACRALNVLLGMSLAPASAAAGSELLLRFQWSQLIVAGGIGLYVVGVTWYARTEASESSRVQLAAGAAVMMLGIAVLGTFPYFGNVGADPVRIDLRMWWLLLMLLGVTIARRSLTAAFDPTPVQVQMAVKQAILSLIVLDAAACLGARGPLWGLAVLALLIPTLTLGRWVYST